MNHTLPEATAWARSLIDAFPTPPENADIWVFPAHVLLPAVIEECRALSWLNVGAQNLHEMDSGAFTGEISAPMLASVGATGALIGHSERRHVFGETDVMVSDKACQAVRHGIHTFLCIGETLTQREGGRAEAVVCAQLEAALSGIDHPEQHKITIAYEPVWAIGTGQTATPETAQQMHAVIRERLRRRHPEWPAPRIVYGGSVKPENAAELMAQPDIDGVLVGGASLDAESFAAIIRAAVS